jgi:3-oxoacyl-[acyl-carrier protein] reductase
MGDFYEKMLKNDTGRKVLQGVGLPTPIDLSRFHGQTVFFEGNILVGASAGASALTALASTLKDAKAQIFFPANARTASDIKTTVEKSGLNIQQTCCDKGSVTEKFDALVFDATGLKTTKDLKTLYNFFSPVIRHLKNNGRILILGRPHMKSQSAEQAASMRALEGFSRSLAKEIGKKSATSQVIYIEKGAEPLAQSAIRFVLSPKSAYVDGQTINVSKSGKPVEIDWRLPLEGKTALVTGGSRGIGKSIAQTLARDGANVFVLDIEPAKDELEKVATEIGGASIVADITAEMTPTLIAEAVKESGGLDIIVHNAGVTRDKMLANMPEHWWDMTLDINLTAEETINDYLLENDILNKGGRIVCVSSMNGIAGQVGQSNYAASKAGVIGYVEFMAKTLSTKKWADKEITINAVAPGFIETAMTDAIPFMSREIGRRMNSLSQGGKPVDVAETISFFSAPDSNGVSGNIVRVCGQCLIGA